MRTLDLVLRHEDESAIQQGLQEKIKTISLPFLQMMLGSNSEVTDHTSHSIIETSCFHQPKPDDERYLRTDLVVRSITAFAVWKALHERYGKRLFDKKSLQICLFANSPEAASAAGGLWEGRCHTRIWNGGRFTLLPMRVKGKNLTLDEKREPEILDLNPMIPVIQDPKVSTCKHGDYYIPIAKNNPTFDAYFLLERLQIALQITISSKHSINPMGFDLLERALPRTNAERAFIFVVPKTNPQRFACPKPTTDLQHKYQYFVLPLEHQDSRYCPSSADI